MTTPEVEEVFTIESGAGIVSLNVLNLQSPSQIELRKRIDSAGLHFFTEVSCLHDFNAHIALIKIGPDVYYPLEKGKNFIFKLSDYDYLLPPNYSSPEDQYLLLSLRNPPNYLIAELQGLFNFFANLSESPPGERWDIDLVCRSFNISKKLYPDLSPVSNIPEKYISDNIELNDRPEGLPSPTAAAIANGIVSGADRISGGLNRGTKFLEDFIKKEGDKIVANQERDREPKQIDPKVVSALKNIRKASQTASSYTDKAVTAIASGARSLGSYLAPHVRQQGTKLVSHFSGSSKKEAGKHVDNVMAVAAGGVQGFGTVVGSIAQNGITLGRVLASQTSNFIDKKYGNVAGQVSSDAILAAGNVALAATDLRNLGPKALLNRAGKEMVAGQYKKSNETGQHSEASTSTNNITTKDKEKEGKDNNKENKNNV